MGRKTLTKTTLSAKASSISDYETDYHITAADLLNFSAASGIF